MAGVSGVWRKQQEMRLGKQVPLGLFTLDFTSKHFCWNPGHLLQEAFSDLSPPLHIHSIAVQLWEGVQLVQGEEGPSS